METAHNGKITFTMPEGFITQTPEQVRSMGGSPCENCVVIRNEALHMACSIEWKRIPLFARGADLRRTADNTARKIQKSISSCRLLENTEKVIDGETACGFRYSYTARNTDIIGEYAMLRFGSEFCSFTCIARAESFESHYHFFEELLDSIELD